MFFFDATALARGSLRQVDDVVTQMLPVRAPGCADATFAAASVVGRLNFGIGCTHFVTKHAFSARILIIKG